MYKYIRHNCEPIYSFLPLKYNRLIDGDLGFIC